MSQKTHTICARNLLGESEDDTGGTAPRLIPRPPLARSYSWVWSSTWLGFWVCFFLGLDEYGADGEQARPPRKLHAQARPSEEPDGEVVQKHREEQARASEESDAKVVQKHHDKEDEHTSIWTAKNRTDDLDAMTSYFLFFVFFFFKITDHENNFGIYKSTNQQHRKNQIYYYFVEIHVLTQKVEIARDEGRLAEEAEGRELPERPLLEQTTLECAKENPSDLGTKVPENEPRTDRVSRLGIVAVISRFAVLWMTRAKWNCLGDICELTVRVTK